MRLLFLTLILTLSLLCAPLIQDAPSCADDRLFDARWSFELSLPGYGISGTLKASVAHIGAKKFDFSGKFHPDKFPLACTGITVNGRCMLSDGKVRLENFTAKIKKAKLEVTQLGLESTDIVLNGNAIYDPSSGNISARELTINAGHLPEVLTSLDYSPEGNGKLDGVIHNPEALMPLAIALSGFTDAAKWEHSGDYTLRVSVDGFSAPVPHLNLTAESMSLISPDAEIMAEGIALNLSGRFDPQQSSFDAELGINAGEALYKTFYFNLNNQPINLKASGTLPVNETAMHASCTLNWSNLLELEADANLSNAQGGFNGSCLLESSHIHDVFKTFAADPFGLDNMQANGTMACALNFTGNADSTSIEGRLSLEDSGFSSKSLNAEGVGLELPINIVLDQNFIPLSGKDVFDPEQGQLNISSLKAGQATVSNLKIPLTVSSRRIVMGELPPVAFSEGMVNVRDMKIDHPFSKNFRLFASLKFSGVNLQPLSPSELPVEGTMNGDLKCWLLKDSFSTIGKLGGEIYGGDVKISEIFARDPFSENRQYGADIQVSNLNLAPLSTALEVGLITGRVDISLTDLLVAYGQPATFHLVAKTSPEYDGDKEISLKAVNSLSVIGTGSGLTGLGVGAFSQFFKEFGYKCLGMECTLDHDIFRIRGLIREGGVEYIIKRPILFGINVINSNPDNLISFSDMLKRIKRVTGGGNNY